MEGPPEALPEAWMRGPIPGVDPLVAPALYSFQQAREDLARYTEGLTFEQLWATPHGFGSVGFHLRHIAGSTGRREGARRRRPRRTPRSARPGLPRPRTPRTEDR